MGHGPVESDTLTAADSISCLETRWWNCCVRNTVNRRVLSSKSIMRSFFCVLFRSRFIFRGNIATCTQEDRDEVQFLDELELRTWKKKRTWNNKSTRHNKWGTWSWLGRILVLLAINMICPFPEQFFPVAVWHQSLLSWTVWTCRAFSRHPRERMTLSLFARGLHEPTCLDFGVLRSASNDVRWYYYNLNLNLLFTTVIILLYCTSVRLCL